MPDARTNWRQVRHFSSVTPQRIVPTTFTSKYQDGSSLRRHCYGSQQAGRHGGQGNPRLRVRDFFSIHANGNITAASVSLSGGSLRSAEVGRITLTSEPMSTRNCV